jgi:hypothetical protein
MAYLGEVTEAFRIAGNARLNTLRNPYQTTIGEAWILKVYFQSKTSPYLFKTQQTRKCPQQDHFLVILSYYHREKFRDECIETQYEKIFDAWRSFFKLFAGLAYLYLINTGLLKLWTEYWTNTLFL